MNNSNIWTISFASVFFVATVYFLFIFTIPLLEKADDGQTNLVIVDTTTSSNITTKSNLVKYVDTIEECPTLPPRDVENLTVHDLRADDITYIMALGDSITAAFGAKGLRGHDEEKFLIESTNKKHKKQIKKDQEFLYVLDQQQQQQKKYLNNNDDDNDHDYNESIQPFDPRNLYENRGLSFAIGGDENATSLARFLNYYSRYGLIGASLGDHLTHIYRLNGAESGAMASNIYKQVDYLLWQLNLEKSHRGTRFVDGNCNNMNTSPEKFEKVIRDTLDSIMNRIPNTIVNLMGVFNVSQVYDVTHGQKYCRWYDVPYINFECTCAFAPGEFGVLNRKIMDDLAAKYNTILQNIVADYSKLERNDFAIVHNRFDLNLTTFPIDGLSNIDCFHPSKKSHEYISKVLWNSLVTPFKERESVISWDDDIKIRCFGEDDRIITY
ncbi:17277_t:CDS:2 [Entrophospora sp. SA101]|nr:17277_t:CDS:2 [Entrophospora sp. SA101]